MPREMPPGIVVLPTGPYPTVSDEAKLVPEFFYQEAVPPPEVLRPPLPVVLPAPAPAAPPAPASLPQQTVPLIPSTPLPPIPGAPPA